MKTTIITALISMLAAGAALAQPAPSGDDCVSPCKLAPSPTPSSAPPVTVTPAAAPGEAPAAMPTIVNVTPQPTAQPPVDDDMGWRAPAGKRFTSGFRLGWMYVANYDVLNRVDNGQLTSIKKEYGLKNPNMFVMGYEGFYRVVGHSWLNVLMVGNVSVAGLDQSKFIPTASGLLGFEIDRSFEIGVGVNLTPDPQAISHMIVAGGWTPRVGSIETPIHFFVVPDSSDVMDANGVQKPGNTRYGATIGMNW